MAQDGQSYSNHVYRPVAWSMTWLIALLAVVVLFVHAWQDPSYVSFTLVVLAGVVLVAVSLIRIFALRLQNRIIRLEMQVRLARLGREPDILRLALPQLIALRFASDGELPALIDRAVAENLSGDAIKRAIKEWRGDYLRT